MNSFKVTFALFGIACTALGGCAGNSGDYPSLAIRDAERVTGSLSPASQPPATALSAQTIESIDTALLSAQSMHARFLGARPQAAALVDAARGSEPESDNRAKALIAMANLTSLHSETAIALAELDRMEVEAATQFAPVDAIRSAQVEVKKLVTDQDTILDALWSEIDG